MDKTTLVIGVSNNPSRYAYLAFNKLTNSGFNAIAVGKRDLEINGHPIHREIDFNWNIHTVTLYVNPVLQQNYYDSILKLKPSRVIFNPGTENPEFAKVLLENEIEAIEACTLVMLTTRQY